MSFFRHIKFWLPLVFIVFIEALFQLGVWEPFTREDSYAGRSVRFKQAIKALGPKRIDFVTIGNSRAIYGIDHRKLADIAERSGYVHVAAVLPGAHFMTYRILSDWLQARATNIKGGILALSVGEMAYMNNGAYELAIVRPFRNLGHTATVTQHIPWNSADPNTYGIYSALFGYNQDIRDLILHPLERFAQMRRFWTGQTDFRLNFTPQIDKDMCDAPSDIYDEDSFGDNLSEDLSDALDDAKICLDAAQKDDALKVPDYGPYLKPPLPPEMLRLKNGYREFLTQMPWKLPPVVVLMPEHDYLMNNIHPKAIHAWAMSILKPLAKQGRIRLYDFTYMFLEQGRADCSFFFDIYHVNRTGRAKLMAQLLPRLEKDLYQR